ncbi:unnamed protein product [Pylaiella littoralis]
MAAYSVSGGVMSYFLSVIVDLVRVAGCSLGVIGNVGRDDAAAQPAGHEKNFFLQAIGTVESRFPYFDGILRPAGMAIVLVTRKHRLGNCRVFGVIFCCSWSENLGMMHA